MHEGANLNIIERVGYYEAVGLFLFEFWNLIVDIIPISRNKQRSVGPISR